MNELQKEQISFIILDNVMLSDAQYSLKFFKNLMCFNIALSRIKNRFIIINSETMIEH